MPYRGDRGRRIGTSSVPRRTQAAFRQSPLMLREIAEYPNSFGPLGPHDERIETDRYTLCMGAGQVVEHRPAAAHSRADEIDEVLEEVRALLRERGRDIDPVGSRQHGRAAGSRRPAARARARARQGPVRGRARADAGAAGRPAGLVAPPRRDVRGVRGRERRAVGGVRDARGRDRREPRAPRGALARDASNVMHAAWLDGEIVSRRHVRADRARPAALRRRDASARPRPRRVPRAAPRALGRGGRPTARRR